MIKCDTERVHRSLLLHCGFAVLGKASQVIAARASGNVGGEGADGAPGWLGCGVIACVDQS